MVRFIHDTLGTYRPVGPNAPRIGVLALGLPRCATSSLQLALETLGHGPCMHMAHVQPNQRRIELVTAAIQERHNPIKRQAILAELFHGFGATSDFPGMVFVEDLMDMYPDAAIILNQRTSAEAWYKSFVESIHFFNSPFFRVVTFLVPSDRAFVKMIRALDEVCLERFGVSFWEKKLYHLHNDWVRSAAKQRGRKVLEFQAEDGWTPLCQFLNQKVPNGGDSLYPRVNDQRTMSLVKGFIICRGLLYWAGLVLLLWVLARVLPASASSALLVVSTREL